MGATSEPRGANIESKMSQIQHTINIKDNVAEKMKKRRLAHLFPGPFWEPFSIKREPAGAKNEPKLSQRATKIHKNIEGAFLERFWVGLWAIRALTPDSATIHFGSIFS